jgi:hypothetical protein
VSGVVVGIAMDVIMRHIIMRSVVVRIDMGNIGVSYDQSKPKNRSLIELTPARDL